MTASSLPLASLDRKGMWGTVYGRDVWAIGEDLTMFSAGHDLRALAAVLHEHRREIGWVPRHEIAVLRQWVHIVDGCGCPENCQPCRDDVHGCYACPDCRHEEYQPCGPVKGWTALLVDDPDGYPEAEPVWAVTAT